MHSGTLGLAWTSGPKPAHTVEIKHEVHLHGPELDDACEQFITRFTEHEARPARTKWSYACILPVQIGVSDGTECDFPLIFGRLLKLHPKL